MCELLKGTNITQLKGITASSKRQVLFATGVCRNGYSTCLQQHHDAVLGS
jgi:hypothetical protein